MYPLMASLRFVSVFSGLLHAPAQLKIIVWISMVFLEVNQIKRKWQETGNTQAMKMCCPLWIWLFCNKHANKNKHHRESMREYEFMRLLNHNIVRYLNLELRIYKEVHICSVLFSTILKALKQILKLVRYWNDTY